MLSQISSSSSFKSGRKIASGCVILFALPFTIPGLLMAAGIVLLNWQVVRQMDWRWVDATVLQAPANVEDMNDVQKGLHYRYDFGGDTFTILDSRAHEPFLTQEEDRETLLNRAREMGRKLPCLVNPASPEEHTLFPARPSTMSYFIGIFTFSHGLVGLLLLMGGLKLKGKTLPSHEAGLSSLERPGQCVSGMKDRRWLWVLVVFLALNAYGAPSAMRLWNPQGAFDAEAVSGHALASNIPVWLAVLMLVLSLLPIRVWLRHAKAVRLNRPLLLSHPTVAGAFDQTFRLSLTYVEPGQELPQEVLGTAEWKLCCKRSEEGRDSDGDRVIHTRTLQSIPLQAMAQGGGSLRLTGENGLPPSGRGGALRLEVTGRTAGGVRLGPFEIPLSQGESEAHSAAVPTPDAAELPVLLAAEQIVHRIEADGSQVWEFSGERFAGGARILWFVGLLMAAADAVIVATLILRGWFEPAGFLIFGLGLASGVMFAIHHYVTAQRSIKLTAQGLSVFMRGWLIKQERHFGLQGLISLKAVTNSSVNNQSYYHLQLIGIDQAGRERRQAISGLMPDERTAQALAEQVREAVRRYGKVVEG